MSFALCLCIHTRLLPVILGHDQEDEEEVELNSPYLLRSGVDSSSPQALPSTGRRRLLTDGSETETEATEATAKSEASEAVAAAAAAAGLTGEEGDGGVSVKAGASRAVVSLTSDGEEDVGDGEVVAFTRRVRVARLSYHRDRPPRLLAPRRSKICPCWRNLIVCGIAADSRRRRSS